ncbi:MAG: hypothetical protein ABIS51_08190 [Sphingomonas sp.]
MATKLLAMSDRATAFAQHQPRVAIGGSILSCLILAELRAALLLRGS